MLYYLGICTCCVCCTHCDVGLDSNNRLQAVVKAVVCVLTVALKSPTPNMNWGIFYTLYLCI